MDNQVEIIRAIEEQRVVTVVYQPPGDDPGERVCHPHALYPGASDNLLLDAWQVGGVSSRGTPPLWSRFDLDRIRSLSVHDETFDGPADGYKPHSDRYEEALIRL